MNRLLLMLLSCGIAVLAQAQITFLSTDLPSVPDTLHNAVDTMPVGIAPGPKGANQTWNFGNAVQDLSENVMHRVPSQTPYSADFPTATVAITADNNNYGYFRKTTTAFTCQGLAGPLLGPGTQPLSVKFNPTFDLYRFPTAYNNAFTGNYGFVESQNNVTLPSPPITVNQVRVTYTATYFDTIDAWGTITTPTGTYQALRQKRVEQTRTLVEYKLFSFSPWATADDSRDTTLTYSWLAKETMGPVATITFNSAGAVNRFTYSLIAPPPPAPVANFSWTNPSGGLVQFTDLSTNATSWSWNYGDGSALGTTQNPSHIYAANGTYNVCLTATNVSGSDTECKNITVSNISTGNNAPVAVDDSVSTNYETPVTVAVLGNDIDPDGDNINLTAAFGATNGTAVVNGNATVTFTPAAGFSGWASFRYSICDDGVPSLCDSATVYVEVGTPPPPAPVADFTWTNPSGGLVQFTDQSTNSPTSWSWDYGDGSTLGTTQNPSHIYAANGTYNVCLTATNVSGSDTECKNVTVSNISAGNNAPVAVDDSVSTNYETPVTVAVLGNDIDPDGDNINLTAAFGATNGTVVVNGNATVTFTPAAGFSGWASFRYSICDDGVPSLCDSATVYVEVGTPPPPAADFTYSHRCMIVDFTNTSTGTTGLVTWTFGDGNTGTGEQVTHTYDTAGTYNVCVSVGGFAGTIDTCYDITVDTCTGIGGINALALQLYPNPARDQLTVVIPQGTQGGKLAIINNLGMLVKEVEVTTHRTVISISELATGIYHLAYTSAEGTKGAGRFVRE